MRNLIYCITYFEKERKKKQSSFWALGLSPLLQLTVPKAQLNPLAVLLAAKKKKQITASFYRSLLCFNR
jgi:hypothetical protein